MSYEVWMTALRRGKIEYERASIHETEDAARQDAMGRVRTEAQTYLKAEVIKDGGVLWGMMSHGQPSRPPQYRHPVPEEE